jgi:hypothetical protein
VVVKPFDIHHMTDLVLEAHGSAASGS